MYTVRPLRMQAALGAALLAILLLPWLPPVNTDFQIQRLGAAAALITIVVGLNVLTGLSGQISLGHSGLALAGAYTAAVLLNKGFAGQDVPPVLAIAAAALVTGLLGFALGMPALRLSGPYLAIATLVLAIAAPVIIKHHTLEPLTGGTMGMVLRPPHTPAALADAVSDERWRYYLIAVPGWALCCLAWGLTNSRFGRALRAIRDSELAAQQMGVDIALYKTTAFAISSAYAGVGGALLVYANVGFVGPDSFSLIDSIGYLTAVVIGGPGSVLGSVFGGLFLAYQTEIVGWLADPKWSFSVPGLDLFSVPSPLAYALGLTLEGRWRPVSNPSDLRWFIYGVTLILVVTVMPEGFAGAVRRISRLRPGDALKALGWLQAHVWEAGSQRLGAMSPGERSVRSVKDDLAE